ncbi:MAG: hypothetical protein QF511_02360 [Rhodospirillales bacterium]|jgi:hypothetical protein|nr:hypothetical protein [Rhodospirillales bacterium]HJP54045.1 hypothetical protein [Rhodospirillales bacterium]
MLAIFSVPLAANGFRRPVFSGRTYNFTIFSAKTQSLEAADQAKPVSSGHLVDIVA